MMKSILELLEEILVSKSLHFNDYINKQNDASPICFIVEGIIDLDLFTEEIQNNLKSKFKLTKINNRFFLLQLNSGIKINQLYLISNLFNYQIRSIFIKECFYDSFSKYNVKKDNFFYLYYDEDNYKYQLKYSQKATETILISSHPKQYLYGFSNYSDFIAFYLELIEIRKKWPVYAISPFIANSYSNNYSENKQNIFIDYDELISKCPPFSPSKFLYYVSFIEKVPPRPTKMTNVSGIYSINKVQDVQISHLYVTKSQDKFIKTFLGFDSRFQCLKIFDYLKKSIQKLSIYDVQLIEMDEFNFIKSNLYYLEVQSLFDSSILFSINYIDSFNFYNDSKEPSTFFSFDNQEDFFYAKELFNSLIKSNYIFKNIKLIDKEDFSLLFPDILIDLNHYFFFIVFRIKNMNSKIDQNQPNISYLFKESFIIRDAKCVIDNKYYMIICFNDYQN